MVAAPVEQQGLHHAYKEKRLKISEDRLGVTGTAGVGYQTVLAQYFANCGNWYFQVVIEDLPEEENAHVRIGWSTRRTRFDQPIGSDCFSFGIRDIDCAKISLGKRFPYGDGQKLKNGDLITCFLSLPSSRISSPKNLQDPLTHLPNLLCDPETVPDDPECLGGDTGTRLFFSVNGQIFSNAFVNLIPGDYHPAVSIFGKAKVRFAFGSSSEYTILHDGQEFRPASQMYVPKELMKPKSRPPNFIPRGLTSGA